VALVLSLAGVYAVTAFAVAKRTREIGVRVAPGAMPRQIIATAFERPFIQIALGIGVAGIMMSILVINESEKPSARDLGPVGVVVVLIGLCCALACLVPVQRALRIEPTEALKDDG
jgi:ABC-type antimicrobial peptide transport system permease subunit